MLLLLAPFDALIAQLHPDRFRRRTIVCTKIKLRQLDVLGFEGDNRGIIALDDDGRYSL